MKNLLVCICVFSISTFAVSGNVNSLERDRGIKETTDILMKVRDAILSYARVQRRLPCPATAASNGAAAPTDGSANCTLRNGFVPVRTLGIRGDRNANNFLVDHWGQPFRYGITNSDDDNDGRWDFIRTGEMQDVYDTAGRALSPDLVVCAVGQQSSCPAGSVLESNVAFYVLSTGKDFSGLARINKVSNCQRENAEANVSGFRTNNDTILCRQDVSETAGSEFDDILLTINSSLIYTAAIPGSNGQPSQ